MQKYAHCRFPTQYLNGHLGDQAFDPKRKEVYVIVQGTHVAPSKPMEAAVSEFRFGASQPESFTVREITYKAVYIAAYGNLR